MTIQEMPTSLQFPELVIRKAPVPALEVGIDYLSEELELRWMDELREFTRVFVERSGFQKKATIWNWCGMSVNLTRAGQRPPGRSMWHVAFGLPGTFLPELEGYLGHQLGSENVRISEYMVPSRADGWQPICHVEQGRAWWPLDAAEWAVVLPPPQAETVAGESILPEKP